jgi:tetratricopeptide (TPR) repeat protein
MLLMGYQGDQANLEKALQLAEKARSLNFKSADVADTLSWAYFKNGKYAQALAIIENTFSVSPDSPTILFHMAAVLYKNGKVAEAKAAVRKSLESAEEFHERAKAELLLKEIVDAI